MSLVVVIALRRYAPVVPGSLVAVIVGVVAVKSFDLADKGVAIVGEIDSGLPSFGLPDGLGFRDYLERSRVGRRRSCSSASPRVSAPPRPTPPGRTTRSTPTASCSASARPTSAAGCRTGMVVNGSLSKTAVNGAPAPSSQVSGLVVAVLTVITLLFLTGLFENLPGGDARRRRHRRRHRARRHRRLAWLLRPLHRSGSAASTARPPGPTSSPPSPPCSACSCSTRCPVWSSASSSPCSCCSTDRRKPHVAELGRVAATDRAVRRHRAPSGERRDPRRPRAADRGRAVLRQRRCGAPGGEAPRRRGPAPAASCSTPRRSPSSTSPRCGCSTSWPSDLARDGQQLVIAHDLGQVGDLLEVDEEVTDLQIVPTIDEAIAAIHRIEPATDAASDT